MSQFNMPRTPPSDNKTLLPVYYTSSRGRYNIGREGPYIMMEDELDNMHDSWASRNGSEVSLARYLPDYTRTAPIELPEVKPLTPRMQAVPTPAAKNEDPTGGYAIPPAPEAKAHVRGPDNMEKFLIWFDFYRQLFTLAFLLNLAALVAVTQRKFGYARGNVYSFALGNLLASILCRNEAALRVLYWLAVKTLFWTPIRIRNFVTAIFVNLGGIHAGCSTAGLMWTIYAVVISFRSHVYPKEILAFAILTPIALAISIAVAMPYVRHNHHDTFEQFHRFVGWLGLAYLWILVILLGSWNPALQKYQSDIHWAKKQEFWYSVILSAMIVAPWLSLQKIPIKVSAPSAKTAFLTFPGGCYTGLLGRLSRSPWLEWHAFGIISEGPMAFTHHMLVVAQGDWTRALISDPPTHVWTRGLKFAGLPYLAEMYERGVIVATGAGIGVTLSVYLQTKGYFHLIWIGSDIEKTYGEDIMGLIKKAVKGDRMTLVDTKKVGRPDTVQLIDNVYRKIDAQVVFITSNPKGTELIVGGCRERGMTAFGPLFDS